MSEEAAVKHMILIYDGGSYELEPAMIDDLVKRGVIVRAEDAAYWGITVGRTHSPCR